MDPRPTTRARRALDALTIVVVLAALVSSRIDEFVRSEAARGPLAENRLPAPMPATPRTLEEIARYPQRFEAHYLDTFGLRDVLLRWNTIVEYFGLGLAPSKDLVAGKDGWIFYSGEATLETLRGLRPIPPHELEAWKRVLENRRDRFAERGCRYLYVCCPNKETIYPERLPRGIDAVGPTRVDELVAYLEANTKVDFLDLRATLRAEAVLDTPDDTAYSPHGTHWNGRGAFAAYRAIVGRLTPWFPDVVPLDASAFRVKTFTTDNDSWDQHMYVEDLMWQTERAFEPESGWRHATIATDTLGLGRTTIDAIAGSTLPRAIVFHDSFGDALQGYLSQHFSQILYVRGGCCLTPQEIADFRPDVAIDLFVERKIAIGVLPQELAPLPEPADVDAEFARARTLLFALDATSPTGGLVARGNASVVAHDDGFEVRSKGRDGEILLPPLDVTGTRAWLRIEATNSTFEPLDVYWKKREDERFRIVQRVSYPFGAQRGTLTLRLELSPGRIDVLLRPRRDDTSLRVHALELRGE